MNPSLSRTEHLGRMPPSDVPLPIEGIQAPSCSVPAPPRDRARGGAGTRVQARAAAVLCRSLCQVPRKPPAERMRSAPTRLKLVEQRRDNQARSTLSVGSLVPLVTRDDAPAPGVGFGVPERQEEVRVVLRGRPAQLTAAMQRKVGAALPSVSQKRATRRCSRNWRTRARRPLRRQAHHRTPALPTQTSRVTLVGAVTFIAITRVHRLCRSASVYAHAAADAVHQRKPQLVGRRVEQRVELFEFAKDMQGARRCWSAVPGRPSSIRRTVATEAPMRSASMSWRTCAVAAARGKGCGRAASNARSAPAMGQVYPSNRQPVLKRLMIYIWTLQIANRCPSVKPRRAISHIRASTADKPPYLLLS